MQRRHLFLAINSAAGIVVLSLSGCGGKSATTTGETPGSREVVLRVQTGADITKLTQEYGVTVVDSSPEDGLYRIRVPEGSGRDSFADRMRKDKRFSAAEPDNGVHAPEMRATVDGFPIHLPFDYVSPKDSRYASLASAYSVASTDAVNPVAFKQINIADTLTQTRGAGVTVAILDTGIQSNHPVLHSHLTAGYNALSPKSAPADVADGTQNQAVGHGTMAAGIVAGVAPEARIMPVRVLNGDGTGSIFTVVRGLRWAVSHGAKVINLSFGTTTASGILQDAIQEAQRAGVTIVAAAGNAGQEVRDYPAGFSGVLAVAAVEADDKRATYSNYGSWISLAAPGSGITSTYVGGGFATWSGTSFAAPFVSGAAALARSRSAGVGFASINTALTANARKVDAVNPALSGKLGSGVLDIARSVATIKSTPSE